MQHIKSQTSLHVFLQEQVAMTIKRHPVWIKVDTSNIFCWIHTQTTAINDHAFIILGPLGPEYMHTYRTVRYLADKISQTGSIAVRYDPAGMGNSSDNLEDNNIWQIWQKTPGAIREYLKHNYGINSFSIIAFRSGSLILDQYIKTHSDRDCLFWYPYTRGAAFIRDMQMLDGILSLDDEKNRTLEGGGYPLTAEVISKIKDINLLIMAFPEYSRCLVIENIEVMSKSPLAKHLSRYCTANDTQFLTGLSDLARQAELSKVPVSNIDSIIHWISENNQYNTPIKNGFQTNTSFLESKFYKEEPVIIKNTSLFGILTRPINNNNNDKLLILTNSGSGHHAGPNRFHTDTARELAKQGIACFRMDLSNLGDSITSTELSDYHPYPTTAASDLSATLSHFESDIAFEKIILGGLCSGAHNSFHCALKDKSIKLCGLILINIITFYWKQGQSILAPEENELEINTTQYQSNIFNLQRWVGIFLNPSKLPRLTMFSIKLVFRKSLNILLSIASRFSYVRKTQLDIDINKIIGQDINIHFLYSENEPVQKILMSQANYSTTRNLKDGNITITKIKNADHTFSSRHSRRELINSIITATNNM